ncbi:MAG: alkaline phosphatase family protein [Microthrixaceae bacterium]
MPAPAAASVDRALEVLLDPDLDAIVDAVMRQVGDDTYEVCAADGTARVRRMPEGASWHFEVDVLEGNNPFEDRSTDRFAGLHAELDQRHPHRRDNAYPFAYHQLAQLWDSPCAPDLAVLHSASHNWEDQGGHLGEHGSIGVVQARAPFIIGGAGVRALGRVDRSCRLIDVAPTVLALLGVAERDGVGENGLPRAARLARQDGEVIADLLDGREPEHVVGFLMDGTNPNVLHDAIDRREAPNLARIAAMGTTMGHGAMASFPTVTLANHTSILTGCHPGHHGVLHNAWYDRALGQQVITNSPDTWATSMQWLRPDVETIHQALHRREPQSFTASVNEMCDVGADFSTFDLMRRRARLAFPKQPEGLPNSTERFVRPHKDYAWFTQVDHHGMQQAVGIWQGAFLDVEYPLPRFMWVNFSLTDTAFHHGGPHSEIARASIADTDARIGEVLAAVEAAGRFDETAFFVVADHGMEESNPAVTGDWGVSLRTAGLEFRDEAYGFLYLDVT